MNIHCLNPSIARSLFTKGKNVNIHIYAELGLITTWQLNDKRAITIKRQKDISNCIIIQLPTPQAART